MKNKLTSFSAVIFVLLISGCSAPSIEVEAYIDGKSDLIIEGNKIWWHHLEFSAPGLWEHGPVPPPLPTKINGKEWYPAWPSGSSSDFCNCDSNYLEGSFGRFKKDIKIEVIKARDSVKIIQQTKDTMQRRAIIEFDDGFGGAEWYKIKITEAELSN